MDFVVPVDPIVKIKENEKDVQMLRLCQKAENLGDRRVTMIPIVVEGSGKETRGIGGQR